MTIWFNDPMQLFDSKQALDMWPDPSQSPAARINATSRFIIYSSIMLYLIKRDIRVFYLGLLTLMSLWLLYKFRIVSSVSSKRPTNITAVDEPKSTGKNVRFNLQDSEPTCQLPTDNNPMGNVLLTDYTDNPTRQPACWAPSVEHDINEKLTNTFVPGNTRSRAPMPDVQRRAAARQFTPTAVTSIPGDQTAFAEWLYGKKNSPMFKDGSSPNGDPNFRGVQLEAFAGLNDDGNIRR